MDEKLPEGTLLKISFEMRLPVAATEADIEEWARYAVCQTGGCSLNNPLISEGPDEWGNSFDWQDTGMIGTREEFDVVETPTGRTWKVRHHRTRRDRTMTAQPENQNDNLS